MINWSFIITVAVILIPCLIVIGIGVYHHKKTDEKYEFDESGSAFYFDNKPWPSPIEMQEERYKNLIAFWLQKLEDNTENLTRVLKVKEFLFDEYNSLTPNTYDGQISFYGGEFEKVIPFVGDDDFFYAICFKKWFEDRTFYRISLIPYAKDKFLNNKMMPVEYDDLYYPTYFVGWNWLTKVCYTDAEVYIPK